MNYLSLAGWVIIMAYTAFMAGFGVANGWENIGPLCICGAVAVGTMIVLQAGDDPE